MPKYYQYTSDGYFVGEVEDYGLLPNNATHTAPTVVEGRVPRWTGKNWEQVEDHKGKNGYINGEPYEIKEYGPLPEGFDDRLTPALTALYDDLNLLKADGMISVGIPATTTARGIGRVATSADLVDGATINNGPAFLVAGIHASVAAAASKMPIADSAGKLNLGWMRGVFVGDIRLVPFRAADLAANCPGWYYCNGDQYLLTSDVGIALNALPANFKADWGIVVASGYISIPKLFHTDGRGFYVRAVNGTARQVGSVATDKFQGHTHGAYGGNNDSFPGPPYWKLANSLNNSGPSYTTIYGTDGSNGSPRTGTETSVLDVGMTPAIFLDV